MLSNILDRVLAKAIPHLVPYGAFYKAEWNATVWSKLEDEIGRIYHSYLRSLLLDPHVVRTAEDLPYSVELAGDPPFGKHVALGAINQRGLFRQNGRATLLEPCGNFAPRTANLRRHDALHHVYMHLVRKAESINQLFLGTTGLRSLSVLFGGDGDPLIELSADEAHGVVHVSRELTDILATEELRNHWKYMIRSILTEFEAEPILDTIQRKGRLPSELSTLQEPRHQPGQVDPLDVIRKWPKLFSQWLSMYPKNDLPNIEKAGILFKNWLRSIAWLMFYCQEGVAGRFFYTVRLPPIIMKPKQVLPETSVSIVCTEQLSNTSLAQLRSIFQTFDESTSFKSLCTIARNAAKTFRSKRLGEVENELPPDETHKALRRVLERLYSDPDELSVDFRQLYFLLNLARSLVGQRHEGQLLRFCLIHGFGFERVDAESNGALQEFHADLLHRWLRFLKTAQPTVDQATAKPGIWRVGEALAKWIKSNDLQLQRPDVAVYLEETANSESPLPIGLVQVRYLSKDEIHPVGTELELRQALRDITLRSNRTVAILTGPSGLFVFIKGTCLLVRCSGREDWDEPFHIHVTGDDKPLEEQIETDLQRLFSETFPDRPDVAKRAATATRHLCEALVSVGHGAMFVVRPKPEAEDSPPLPPLNPVWLIRSHVDGDDFRHECAIYSLMAALDGATELLLPLEATGAIEFRCRRYAQTLREDWVWTDDPDEPGHAVPVDVALSSMLVGKGTRHHTALVLSKRLIPALIMTVSADGPVTIYRNGVALIPPSGKPMRFAP